MREGFILAKTSWSKFMGYSLRLDRILGAICAIVSIPAWAQFPRPCTDTTSIMLRECCPIGFDGSKCGEESRRGFCVEIPMLPANLTVNESLSLLLDDRAWWPLAFYDRACKCVGNFDGVRCSRCKYGYEGTNCEQRSTVKVRRNITKMAKEEIEQFIAIVDESKRVISEEFVILTTSFHRILQGELPTFSNASIYDVFVWMHYYVTRDNLLFSNTTVNNLQLNALFIQQNRLQVATDLLKSVPELQLSPDVDYAHEGSAFLPWHRYFMLKWEREIGEYVANDPDFTLPFWDWQDQTECNVCNDLIFGGQRFNNESLLSIESPFSRWSTICTKGNEYILNGHQCTGEAESFIQRNPGNYDPTKITGLPSSNEINNMLQLDTNYDSPGYDGTANMSYRNILEGFANPNDGIADSERSFVHNAVHLFMNGTMSSVDTSANDPIFIVHHVFVDSLFEAWLRKQQRIEGLFQDRNGPRFGHRFQDFMVPFFPLVQNRDGFASTLSLGYVYDYMTEMESSSDEELLPDTSSNDVVDVFESSADAFDDRLQITREDFPFSLEILNEDIWRNTNKNLSVNWRIKSSSLSKSNKRKNKFKNRKKHHHQQWNHPRFYEGTNRKKLNGNGSENWLVLSDQKDVHKESSAVAGAWESLQESFSNVNSALRNMSSEEKGWMILACCLVVGCLLLCACICCSRSRGHKDRDCCCCCCRRYQGEEEEYYALLDTSKIHHLPNE